MRMPSIINKVLRVAYLTILSLALVAVSFWAGADRLRVSAQKPELSISKIYVNKGEPGAASQNSFIETFDPFAPANETGKLNSAPAISPDAASDLRISQVYTRGGEPGASFQNDYVEIFNAGSSPVDINGWAVVAITFEGSTEQSLGGRFTSSFMVSPGMHLLIRFNGNGSNGQPTPGEYPPFTDISLGSTSGQIMLLAPNQTLPTGCPATFGPAGAVADFVGYGATTCSEGSPAPVPPANQSLTRINGGCTDTDNNFNDFSLVTPNPRISTSALTPCGSVPTPTPPPVNPQFNFATGEFKALENAGTATIIVTRSGNTATAATVNFATSNGTATAGSDYTSTSGTLSFAAGETQKTFNVTIIDDNTLESNETVNLTLSNPTGGPTLGFTSTATLVIQDNEAPPISNSNLRISQVYVRGGEAGATFQQDFVEIFNAGGSTIDLNGWALVVITSEGTTQQAIGARFNNSFAVPPGMHLLLRFNGNGTNGQPAPGEYPVITELSLGSTSGQIFLLSPTQTVPSGCPTSFGVNGAVTDLVGYGSTACSEGPPLPVPPSNQSLMRINGGCTDTNSNLNDFSLATPNPRISTSPLTSCGSTPPQASQISFSASQYDVSEGAGKATITVTRTGQLTGAATVNFTTLNGSATAGSDYTTASGTLSFAAGETQKTFDVLITDDAVPESDENVVLNLSNPTGTASLGLPSSVNLIIHDNDVSGATSNLRISQIYTRGGEPGAAFQHDFIELFNAGSVPVDILNWTVLFITDEAERPDQTDGATFTTSFIVPPGMHLLLRFPVAGTNGQPTPGEYPPLNNKTLGSNFGRVELLNPSQPIILRTICPTAIGPNGQVTDLVGYGSDTCFEGAAPLVVPPANQSMTRINGGCTDSDNNRNDFAAATPNPRISTSAFTPCGSATTASNQVSFAAAQFDGSESAEKATITVTRSGDLSSATTVDYTTANGTATERTDFTTATGTLRFAAGESQKTFDVLINKDSFVEPSETVNLSLSNATGAAGLTKNSAAQLLIRDNDSTPPPNVIDTTNAFVDQHYHDFLNRAPDAAGLQFWINNMESCGSNVQCREVKRIDTSASFFLSIEFQRTGVTVYRAYKAAFPESSRRPRALPRYNEFMRDTQEISRGVIVGTAGAEALLESNTVAFFKNFVSRDEFLTTYSSGMSASQFVDALNARIGNVLSSGERNDLVNGLAAGQETRATVLRKIVENKTFSNAEANRAFVLMEYFGYLRRNPNDTPDNDFAGYDFWLTKLNQFGGDYNRAEMVKAFITSTEYRARFGQ